MKKSLRIFSMFVATLFIGVICFGGYKFLKHEDQQNQRMRNLEYQVAFLWNKVKSNNDSSEFIQACRKNGGGGLITLP